MVMVTHLNFDFKGALYISTLVMQLSNSSAKLIKTAIATATL